MAIINATDVIDGLENQKQINDKHIQVVESIELLRNYIPRTNGQIVMVKAHTVGTNKGGGKFIYKEDSLEVDNNGTIIKSSVVNGTFSRLYDSKEGYFEWFGAQCDGINDDTNAVISTLKVLKRVHFSNRIKLTSPIDLDQFKTGQTLGITISGDGTEASFLEFENCNKGFYSKTNTFFRDFNLENFQIVNKNNNQTGLGIYIGSGGAEQINFKSISFRGWLIGRSSHTWNSSFNNEVFRLCKYPYVMYGTSTNVNNPYAIQCSGPYMIGYSSDVEGLISIPAIPYAYSLLSAHAADDCGADGAIFKFGRCAGLTAQAMGGERPKGRYIFDFSEMVPSSVTNVVVENYAIYITATDSTLLGLIKKPEIPFGNIIFNNLKVSTDKEIFLVSGDGSGITLNNPQMGNRNFSRITEVSSKGIKINNLSVGQDSRENGEVGYSLSANGITYTRVKTRKGKVLLDPNVEKLVLFCGSLSEGLAQGNMMAAILTILPLNKSGNNINEKAGQVLISSSMDYNASNMDNHLKVVKNGSLTSATFVKRNTENSTILQFDIFIEVTASSTRYLVDIDLTFNGIANTNGLSWQVLPKL